MIADDFRKSPERVSAMRVLLDSNPILAEAIVVLKDEAPIADAIDGADAVVSVRLLSRAFGHNQCIATFLSLAEPPSIQPVDAPPTWGNP